MGRLLYRYAFLISLGIFLYAVISPFYTVKTYWILVLMNS